MRPVSPYVTVTAALTIGGHPLDSFMLMRVPFGGDIRRFGYRGWCCWWAGVDGVDGGDLAPRVPAGQVCGHLLAPCAVLATERHVEQLLRAVRLPGPRPAGRLE